MRLGASGAPRGYQACSAPQWGQPTVVWTSASNTNPQLQLYVAVSCTGS